MNNKLFLQKLPLLNKPFPEYETSDEMVVIIPIFGTGQFSKAAAWALYSWMMYTDAKENGVYCCLYIHDDCKEEVLPILQENNVPQENILTFNSELESMAIRFNPIVDDRFKKYNYIVNADSDLFITSDREKKLEFFKMIKERNNPNEIGLSYTNTCPNSIRHDLRYSYWWDREEEIDYETLDDKYNAFIEKIKEGYGEEISDLYHKGGFLFTSTFVSVMGRSIIDTPHRLYDLLKFITHDETAISLLHHTNPDTYKIWDINRDGIVTQTDSMLDIGNRPLFTHIHSSLDTVWIKLLSEI